jgi:hypothetical protein
VAVENRQTDHEAVEEAAVIPIEQPTCDERPAAFVVEAADVNLHPPDDGSLHMALPPAVAALARRQGWAEPHPMAERGVVPESVVMVYAPRDADELDVVVSLVRESYRYAGGRA